MIRTLFLMLRSSIKILLNNKIRFVLTIIGIGVGLFVLAVGIETINVYTEKECKKIDNIDRNACMLYSQYHIDVGEALYKLKQNDCRFSYMYYKKSKDLSNITYTYKNSQISNNLCLLGASYDFQNGYFCYTDEASNYLGKVRILYGKSFSKSQYQNEEAVCVLEKSTSELLFGKENSVGNKLILEINDITYEFNVIAIIDDLPMTSQNNLKVNSSIRRGEDIIVQRNVIVPLSWYSKKYENVDRSQSYVIFDFHSNDLEKGRNIVENCNYDTDNIEIVDYESMFLELNDFIEGLKRIVDIVLLCIFILSGLIIMNTMFFSIKERIREIGIRRALGADSKSILGQVIFESIILGIISYILTILLTDIIFTMVSVFMLYILGVDYIISLHTTTYGTIFLMALIESISFSVFPSIYATKIKPVEAVLFN